MRKIGTTMPLTALALAFAAPPAMAQSHDDHASHATETKVVIEKDVVETGKQDADHASHIAHSGHGDHMDEPGEAIIAYRDALVELDFEAAGVVFAEDSLVFENGKAEGSWTDYAEHHLGPELGHFVSFGFPEYQIEIRQDGHYAFAVERYTHRIELHEGRVTEREGVATSVLRHGRDGWKIQSYHSSSRVPKK